MDTFVKTQVQWNSDSEDLNDDHLQGGALSYINSPLTLDANSDFRLMNRTPTNQTGKQAYTTDNSLGGYELLLANDVDNSNPVVQAEDLNWLYYLLNLGTILKGDSDANFDSVRVDAVDNVDADLLQIVSQYMADAYKTNESDANANAHLSILEDWSYNDAQYQKDNGASQLTINNYMHTQMIYSLTKDPSTRSSMKRFLEFTDYDRSNDSTENIAIPNYAFVRAHDSEVQTVIAQIIKDLYPN
ncbi:hypothetical protein EFS54_01535 [Periweissella beninensis]|nr:hypothetical protein [Periweissella beninensis]